MLGMSLSQLSGGFACVSGARLPRGIVDRAQAWRSYAVRWAVPSLSHCPGPFFVLVTITKDIIIIGNAFLVNGFVVRSYACFRQDAFRYFIFLPAASDIASAAGIDNFSSSFRNIVVVCRLSKSCTTMWFFACRDFSEPEPTRTITVHRVPGRLNL